MAIATKTTVAVCLLIAFIPLGIVSAHQPNIVRDDLTAIEKPETSQVFYGELKGKENVFKIVSEKPFKLYLQILSPKIPEAKKNFFVDVYRGESRQDFPFATLDPNSSEWKETFEPFARDSYYEGPELEQQVEAGTYLVVVSNPTLRGKYSLTVGKQETFSPRDVVRALVVLPEVKQNFFLKSPLSAYFNPFGLFLWVPLFLVLLIAWYVVKRKIKNPTTGL